MVVPVFLAFLQRFRREAGAVLGVPVTFGILGSALLALGFMVDTGSMIYYFAPAVAATEGPNVELIMQAAQLAQDSIEVTWLLGASSLMAV